MAGLPERLELPTDRPYPPVADYRGASVAVEWPAQLQQQVARVAREHNATSFMVVQAALAVLLGKLGASSDVAVGFAIAGRVIRRWMSWWGSSSTRWCCGWIWMVIPPLPACSSRCVSAVWAPTSIRTCPLRCWWIGSTPRAVLTHHPLVQVMLAWQNFPGQTDGSAAESTLGDVQVTPLAADTHTARMDLVFVLGRALDRDR